MLSFWLCQIFFPLVHLISSHLVSMPTTADPDTCTIHLRYCFPIHGHHPVQRPCSRNRHTLDQGISSDHRYLCSYRTTVVYVNVLKNEEICYKHPVHCLLPYLACRIGTIPPDRKAIHRTTYQYSNHRCRAIPFSRAHGALGRRGIQHVRVLVPSTHYPGHGTRHSQGVLDGTERSFPRVGRAPTRLGTKVARPWLPWTGRQQRKDTRRTQAR
ncbi:hypothetical protein F5148DRAFT_552651 [Russula earlei]|uniref:Uncharacterized protein n=1 Tax=Russula earlei TaxID=71964 RepID=A0ACC0TWM7_9AGAM|nr:hypothetical protein F5148DRAFT_552651 [Russula earlei]